MDKSLVVQTKNPLTRQIDGKSKNKDSQIAIFIRWLDEAGLDWYRPNLAAWRDDLQSRVKNTEDGSEESHYSPSTIKAYLSTVRGAYLRLLVDNEMRDVFYAMTPADAPPERKKALVDELERRIRNAIDPTAAPVKQIVKQDRADSEFVRLNATEASRLIAVPDRSTVWGKRDAALLALALCTGIREGELCALLVDDLRQQYGNELALLVEDGKGGKQRLIPYGNLDACLVLIDEWLVDAGITSGYVFRGFYKGFKKLRPGHLTPRSVQRIVGSYPIAFGGECRAVKPHDLRRSYARINFENGMDIIALQQNLGHADLKTTQHYIGTLDGSVRRPAAPIVIEV